MQRRDFFKSIASMVAATAVAPSVIAATQPDVIKAEKPNSDIFAAKKIKEGFLYLSTGNAALDEALGGGILYGSNVIIAGEAGTGKNMLLRDIHNANADRVVHKDYVEWGENHILKNDIDMACVYHFGIRYPNERCPQDRCDWSFFGGICNSETYTRTTFKIIKTRFGHMQSLIDNKISFEKLANADILITTFLDSYYIGKNRFGKCCFVKRAPWHLY